MGKGLGLEELRSVFEDKRTHIAVAKITKIFISSDRSFVNCFVSVFPEQREIVAKMSWDAATNGSGIFAFPQINDLVLIAFADGNNEQVFVIKRLSSKEDLIPSKAINYDTVISAIAGKKLHLNSNTKINLTKPDNEGSENLVLGQELKSLLSDILQKLSDLSLEISTHTHAGNLGYPTSPPMQAAQFINYKSSFDAYKSSPVEDETILSNIAFTEKGD